ncbi:MAG: SAF domain-containing protein [Acidipropionibacterium sp.]|nr:SAF domain-containing protein [Acidipropionibacterium sp.]
MLTGTSQRTSARRGAADARPAPNASGESRRPGESGAVRAGAMRAGAPPGRALPNRRSPVLVVAGVLCAVLGALGGAFAWTQASRAESVLVMTRDVPRGEELRQGDIGVVSISAGDQVQTLPASRLDGLIGRSALVDLPRGSLLGASSVGDRSVPADAAHLGLKLAAGRVPTSPMPAGTRIRVVEVAPEGAGSGGADGKGASTGSPRTIDAVVFRAPVRGEDRTSWLMDIEVPQSEAAVIADLAARDRVAVIVRGS